MDLKVYRLSDLPGPIDLSCLSEEEQGFHEPRQTARALLRQELHQRLRIPAADIRFTRNEHGKPEVEGQHFNISHSGDCLCMAFHHLPVGVDVERIRPRANMPKLARQFMGEEQAAAFMERGCPEEEFYACWCTAEALVKCAGISIWQAKQYPFLYHHGKIQPLFENAPEILLFTPQPGYCGAVAFRNTP